MWLSMVQDFRQNPEQLCAHLPPVILNDAATRVHYSIQDTPGCAAPATSQHSLACMRKQRRGWTMQPLTWLQLQLWQ